MHVSAVLTISSLILSFAAAVLWGASAAVDVPGPPRIAGFELTASINPVVHALRRAARYTQFAAALTCLSIATQIGAYLLAG